MNMFYLNASISLAIVLTVVFVQPAFATRVPDGTSTDSGENGGCRHTAQSAEGGSVEDCIRQNITNCLVCFSKESSEAENCDDDDDHNGHGQSTPSTPSTTPSSSATTTTQEPSTTATTQEAHPTTYENTQEPTSDGQYPSVYTPKPPVYTPKPPVDGSCKLLDALENITEYSEEFSDEQKIVLVELYVEIRAILVSNVCEKSGWGKSKKHRCQLKKVLKILTRFNVEYPEISAILEFKQITAYGTFLNFEYACKTVCAQDSSNAIEKKPSSNCTVCDALNDFANSHSDVDFQEDCSLLVYQLRIVFNYDWDNSKKKGWASGQIKRLISKYPQYARQILDLEYGDEGDDIESFGEGCAIYEKIQGLPDVLGGTVDSCPLLQAMRNYYLNVSAGTVNERSLIKQLCDKLSEYYEINVDIGLRLSYYNAQSYQFLRIAPGMARQLLKMIIYSTDGSEWGTCYDVSFSQSFCDNFGCGSKTGGPGQFPSMGDRGRLIIPDSSNNTICMTAINAEVASARFTAVQRLQFNSYRNSLQYCIYSPAECLSDGAYGSGCRVNCVTSVIRSIVATLRVKIVIVRIPTWYGEKTCSENSTATIGNFCGCS